MREYEFVEHLQMEDLSVFLVELSYRSPHMHKEYEICMVLEGKVTVSSGQQSTTFYQGDLMILNPHQSHELQAVSERVVLLSVQAASGFCARVYPSIRRLTFEQTRIGLYREDPVHMQLKRDFLNLGIQYLREEENYEFFCMSKLYELFGTLLKTQKWHLISEEEKMERYNKGVRLSRIINYIETHVTEKVTLTEIAENENLSMHYLSHFFKEMLGISFQEYVALLRFRHARKLIERTNKSIAEICLECGFSDYRYLNKIYKKQVGYTPADYRKNHKIYPIEEKEDCLGRTKERYLSREESIKCLEKARKMYCSYSSDSK